jgi:hypothetical protein
MDEIGMTGKACLLGNRSCIRFQLNDIGKVSARKGRRMEHSVVRFRKVFRQEAVGRVAVVTHSRLTVAGFDPTIIFGTHDMTVEARTRVVGQIGRSSGIDKRKDAEPDGYPDGNSKEP